MGMIRALVALYPGRWRAEFGDEFTALLEDTRLTPGAVADVAVQAGKLQVAAHRWLSFMLAALLWSACLEVLAVHEHLTANILWVPTTPARALALAATVGPWVAGVALARRMGIGRRCGGSAAGRAS